MKVELRLTAAALLLAAIIPHADAQVADPRAQAAALIDAGQAVEACAVLEQAYGRDAAENDVTLMQAHCSWRAGRVEDAIGYYRELIERLPDAARPRAELATLYLQLGRQDAARAEFDAAQALDHSAGAASVLGGLARAMMTEDPSVLARAIPKNWQVQLYTGLVNDSNINSGPNGTTIAGVIGGVPVDLTLNDDSKPIHSWGSTTNLTGRYLHALNPRLALLAQGSLAKTFYFRDNDFDNDSVAAALGLLYRAGGIDASLQPSLRLSRQANETVERTYGINGRASKVVAPGLRATGAVGYFKRDTPKNDARKAEGYLVSAGLLASLNAAAQVGVEYMGQTEDAREDFESRTSHGPLIYGTWHAHPALSLNASYRYSNLEYDEIQGIFPHAREDDQHVLDVGALWDVSRYLYPGTSVGLQYSYIRSESNLELFDNRRHITTLRMQVVF